MLQRLTLCFFLFSLSVNAQAEWFYFKWSLMGTLVELEYESKSLNAELIAGQVKKEFQRLENRYSPYIESSELSKINRLKKQQALRLDDESWFLFSKAQHYAQLTGGAFDISFASVGFLYNYREQQAPNKVQHEKALGFINYKAVKLDEKNRTIRLLKSDMKLDLGGIAKGYAVDKAIAILKAAGVTSAWVSAGGDSRVIGLSRQSKAWIIGIKHPRKKTQYALKIPLTDTAVSTSGDYERFFIDSQGVRQHHIINPKTGLPARGLISVTILAPQSIDADALSTSAFVLGEKRALDLVNQLPDIEAILINDAGKVSYSKGLSPVSQTKESS